jgi:hypothetical protein
MLEQVFKIICLMINVRTIIRTKPRAIISVGSIFSVGFIFSRIRGCKLLNVSDESSAGGGVSNLARVIELSPHSTLRELLPLLHWKI